MRPSTSITAEMPVLATRTSGTRPSIARKVACARCWWGAEVGPYQASLVTFTRKTAPPATKRDRKSTRLNSSHGYISYAVFCLKKKNPYRTQSDACEYLELSAAAVCLQC